MRSHTILSLCLLLIPTTAPASSDRCRFPESLSATSDDGRFALEARFESGRTDAPSDRGWRFELKDTKEKSSTTGTLEKLSFHIHPQVLITSDGRRIAVFNPSAGRSDDDRLLVLDNQGKLLKSFGLRDFLNDEEYSKVTRSVSHVHGWTEGTPLLNKHHGQNLLVITTNANRSVYVSLDELKVLTDYVPCRCAG